jgi:hypothetical protein
VTLVPLTLLTPLPSLGNLEVVEIAHFQGLELVEVLQLLVNPRSVVLNECLSANPRGIALVRQACEFGFVDLTVISLDADWPRSMFTIPVVIEVDGICELDIVDDKAVKLISEFDGRRVELS